MTRNIKILLFYKFHKIEDPEWFARDHKRFCNDLGILGKVLVSKEGVNGSVSGTVEQMEDYKGFLRSKEGFEDVWFKEEMSHEPPFTKMFVRVKKELIRMEKDVDMLNKKGKYISPDELIELYDSGEKFTVIDTRNDYEYKAGRFKGAINPDIKTFRQFPDFVDKIKDKKDEKIIIYCTGGIRCEKASVYMEEQGFKDVKQVHGGIINFCQEHPDTVWEGRCFVFDKRLMTDINQTNPPITNCELCGELCDLYRNCKSHDCDKLMIMCTDCEKKMNACCSEKCLADFRRHCLEKAMKNQGRKINAL